MRLRDLRLFPRMALHIGAALAAFILIGAGSLALIAAWELRGYIETRHSLLGQEAAAVLTAGGKPALVNWLQSEADIPADVSIYILDNSSRDILGRKLPGQYAEFIRSSVIGQPETPGSNFRPARLAPQLVGPDGDTFAFLVLPKGISLWGSPMTALGLLAAALLVIASVAWLIARAFSRPINDLQLAVRELASGHTDARVPAALSERGDELGTLAADFNTMADRLTDLIAGREKLLREMSHELRSPLARLQAAIALAAEHDSMAAIERERVEQEIARMNRVIGEMLHYSSLEATVAPRRRLLRIDKLLRELIHVEEIEASSHGCQLKLDAQNDLAFVGDPELLQRGFENILRNAIRYAPQGSTVEISAQRQNANPAPTGDIVIEFSDRGPGVATEHLQRIFEPYYRVASGSHHQDSTGLGLAIVRRVFERHNGTVSARQREGGGLIVTVRLAAAELS